MKSDYIKEQEEIKQLKEDNAAKDEQISRLHLKVGEERQEKEHQRLTLNEQINQLKAENERLEEKVKRYDGETINSYKSKRIKELETLLREAHAMLPYPDDTGLYYKIESALSNSQKL